MDLVLATVALLGLNPLFLIIAVLIVLDSPGPVFFLQSRTGYSGRKFRMMKFRTMVPNASQLKAEVQHLNLHSEHSIDFKAKDDPRVTSVGRFLRRFSLDEIPNLFNVVMGQMSLIGPRPTSFDINTYPETGYTRLGVRPGITGLWQVSGRSNLDFEDRVRLDLEYIENQSLWLDLKIMVRTPMTVLRGIGAC